jgi:transposase InsO family protein
VKLTVFGRQLVVQRIIELGWPAATAAQSLRVSRATAYKWLARWRADGQAGLTDRSSRPRHCPYAMSPRQAQRILRARRRTATARTGPALGHPRSTVYGVLRRHGLSRMADTAARLGIRLKRTRPYRPQTNGKVERYHRTLLDEWAYARLYRSNAERRRALGRFLDFYNHRRPHTALGGVTPMAVLINNVDGNHT